MAGKDVRLYYLGGLAPDEKAHPISAGSRVFRLPPIGEYIEVSPFYAKELIDKFKVITKDAIYDAFTTDARIAKQAMDVKMGRTKPAPKTVDTLSDAELLALMRERGLDAVKEPEAESPVDEEAGNSVDEAEALTGASKPATKTTRKTTTAKG